MIFLLLVFKNKTNELNIIPYLRFVGYNSGVYKKRALNDPVMADFPANVVIMEAIFALLSVPKGNNISLLKN